MERWGPSAICLVCLTLVVALGWPAPALAAGGGGHAGTGVVVILLLFVAAAYVLTHFVIGRLQRTLLVVSGVEYILLGILLGPVVPQIRAFEDLGELLPVIALAAGWIGLLRGMELDFSHMKDAPRGASRVALGDDLITGILVAGSAYLFFTSGMFVLGIDDSQAWMSGGVLACCAAVGSTEPIEVIKKRYHVEGPTVPMLRRAARVGDVGALLVFGLLFCVFHQDEENTPLVLRPTEWAVVSVGLGAALGLLFRPFLIGDESENSRFLALVGIITFASGAAWFLNLSPLLVNLVLGTVLVNTAKAGPQIHATVERTKVPMNLVLLVFAGALWSPPPLWPTVAATCAFIVLRFAGKWIGSRLAAWGQDIRNDLHRGLMGHGVVTIAMAISFRLVYSGPAVDVAYTVILASVVFHDLAAPRVLRALLVDTGELRREQEAQ